MIDINRVKLIVVREWRERVRMRSFRIATLVQVAAIIIAACIPVIVAWFTQDDEPEVSDIVVLDESGSDMVTRLANLLGQDGIDQQVDVQPASGNQDALSALVDDGDADVAVLVQRDDQNRLTFLVINDGGEADLLTQRLYAAASSLQLQDQLGQVGVPQADVDQLQIQPVFSVQSASDAENDTNDAEDAARYLIAYLAAMLSYMAILIYGTWVAQGVVEEKASRIMEIMVNVATPRDLLVGKIIGISAAAFTQLLPMVVLGGIAFSSQKYLAEALDIENVSLLEIDFGQLSLQAAGVFLVFFLLGFILYASLFAAIGSMVSRQEEVNQAVSPLTMLSIVGLFGAIFTMSAPDSQMAQIFSLVPFTAGISMVPRVLLGDPPWWEIMASAVILLITCAIAFWLAARIYRVGVLMYGQKPSFRAMFQRSSVEVPR